MIMIKVDENKRPELGLEAFNALSELIYKRTGIYYTENKKYLIETRLRNRLDVLHLKSFDEYVHFVNYNGSGEAEINKMIQCIVTNETSFYRDVPQLETFKSKIIPAVMEYKKSIGDKTIRFWSAACSTGEEPYTLAMIASETVPINMGWKVEIYGTDISDQVLESAERGIFNEYSLKTTSELEKNKYFTKTGNVYQLRKSIKDMVKFKKVNLYSMMDVRAMGSMDIIFCRNVLIYFNDYSKKKVISHLYDALNKNGFLVMGSAESLHTITRLFKPGSFEGSLAYQKK